MIETSVNNTFNFIDKGKSGKNIGFDYSIDKLNKYIKIWRGRYYLIFALSGVGKSKFVYHQHIFNVIDQQINHKIVDNLKIDLYSLEISPVTVIGNAIIFYLAKYKNIITDTNQLFSFDSTIPKDLYKIIQSKETQEYIKKFKTYIDIYTRLNFSILKKNTESHLQTIGTINKIEGNVSKFVNTYDKSLYQIIIDHISLIEQVHGKNKYESIGIISRYLFAMRNIADLTPVIVQQVKPNRMKKIEDTVSPSHEDLRDSPETFNDSDIAIAIGNPFKHKIRNFNGYKIYPTIDAGQGLQDRFRFEEIRKNRYGSGANRSIASGFIGETGMYYPIKPPLELKETDYLAFNNITKTYKNKN